MKVLLAEDDPMSQFRLNNLLESWGYEPVVAATGREAWEALQGPDMPPIVVLDWMMPEMNGVEVCLRIRQSALKPYIYVILLTGKDQREDIVHGLEAGADDYITKPFDAHELRARLHVGRRIVRLQAELLATREDLRVRATRDGLTGLWNRAAIMEMLKLELGRAECEPKPGAILLLDLDNFKQINDTLGPLAGDAVLCQVAERARRMIRESDAIGRYGGQELLALLPGCNSVDAMILARRLLTDIAKPLELSEESLCCTASVGAACWRGTGKYDLNLLLRAADSALQRAKTNGRNRVELANSEELRAMESTAVSVLRQG